MDDVPADIPEYRYNYSYVFPFEADFKPLESIRWMKTNWTLSFLLSAAYLAIIYVGQKWMANRRPYDLKTLLVLWNTFLAILSIFGTARFLPDFLHALFNYGFQMTVCICSIHIGVTAFWSDFFAFSKALELTDTTFLILRKRPIVFLHWYHHVTVMIYTWHGFKDYTGAGRWFIMMNYAVHSVMYSYYAMRAWGMNFPRWVPMSITMFQLSQMVVGVGVSAATLFFKLSGVECRQSWENFYLALLMYFTYFLLFARLFYDSYFGSKRHRYERSTAAQSTASVQSGMYDKFCGESHGNYEDQKSMSNGSHRNGFRKAVKGSTIQGAGDCHSLKQRQQL